MRYLSVFLLILGFVTPEYALQAQPLDCGADDGQCLEDSLGLACSYDIEAFEETCLAWAQRVEAHSLAANPEWRLVAAAAYYLLAELADSEVAVQGYSERSRAINQDVLTQWPVGPFARQAYVGLSNLVFLETEDLSEVIRLGRMAVEADPEYEYTMWGLANWLVQRGESGDRREAADLYCSAYVAGGSRSWYWAANALGLYRSTGQTDQAEFFLDNITRDSGMDGFVEEVVSSRFARDPERAAGVLENATVSGYETAVRLAPGNGEYRYRLAREIFKQGRLDEAIAQLKLARDTLPARSGITVESVDKQIRIIEMAR